MIRRIISLQGLYNLAQFEEESHGNESIPMKIWSQLGVNIERNISHDRYRKLQTIYHQ